MTTTKRSVDAALPVYQRATSRMLEPARTWIDYTNARKQNAEQARQLEQAARRLDLAAVPINAQVGLPKLTPPRERVANINYAVPRQRLRQLAEAFGDINMTYRDVGLNSFDYAFDGLVDDDSS